MQAAETYYTMFIPDLQARIFHITAIEDVRKPEGLTRIFHLGPCDSGKMTREVFTRAMDENKIVAVFRTGNIAYLDRHSNSLATKHVFWIKGDIGHLREPGFVATPVDKESYGGLISGLRKTINQFPKAKGCVIL